MDETRLDEGVIALLASFYLLDFDYLVITKCLIILQQHIFKDINVPQDIAGPFQSVVNSYRNFKTDLQ
jgi:hypothetical protein